jgi:hypothetical protein
MAWQRWLNLAVAWALVNCVKNSTELLSSRLTADCCNPDTAVSPKQATKLATHDVMVIYSYPTMLY